jgi:hypothetical protein
MHLIAPSRCHRWWPNPRCRRSSPSTRQSLSLWTTKRRRSSTSRCDGTNAMAVPEHADIPFLPGHNQQGSASRIRVCSHGQPRAHQAMQRAFARTGSHGIHRIGTSLGRLVFQPCSKSHSSLALAVGAYWRQCRTRTSPPSQRPSCSPPHCRAGPANIG